MRISEVKKEKISEQILALLYSSFPRMMFTAQIAREIARDEEFVKNLLDSLKKKNLVMEIKKNSKGVLYLKRTRWKMGDEIYKAYKGYQKF